MAKRRFHIDQLIINPTCEELTSYWSYDRELWMFERKEGRRPAGYVAPTPGLKAFGDPGVFGEKQGRETGTRLVSSTRNGAGDETGAQSLLSCGASGHVPSSLYCWITMSIRYIGQLIDDLHPIPAERTTTNGTLHPTSPTPLRPRPCDRRPSP